LEKANRSQRAISEKANRNQRANASKAGIWKMLAKKALFTLPKSFFTL
jgi:hypothetical protein